MFRQCPLPHNRVLVLQPRPKCPKSCPIPVIQPYDIVLYLYYA